MTTSQLATADEERVETLRRFHLLDTQPEACFDKITQVASTVFEVPISVISLVDANRQWFKSKVGLDACSTDRDIAFCHHAIQQDDIFEVVNPCDHEDFKANPLVTGEMMNIRYYAGMPLTAYNGDKLGTLCLISESPRAALSDKERDLLRDLAEITMHQLELRRANLNALALIDQSVTDLRLNNPDS